MVRNDSFLRAVLSWICAGHVITGLLLMSGKAGIRTAARLYGAEFEPTDQFQTIVRPAGAFVLALGLLQGMAAWRPRRYRAVIDATLLVFLIRQIQRFIFRREVYSTFKIPPHRHWAMTIYFGSLAGLLLLARIRMARESE